MKTTCRTLNLVKILCLSVVSMIILGSALYAQSSIMRPSQPADGLPLAVPATSGVIPTPAPSAESPSSVNQVQPVMKPSPTVGTTLQGGTQYYYEDANGILRPYTEGTSSFSVSPSTVSGNGSGVPCQDCQESFPTATPGCDCDACRQSCRERHIEQWNNPEKLGPAAHSAAMACYNCRTNGSYKFPVSKQYTYFWPGIYSQKTMTEYVAPYQGLRLTPPSEVFGDSESAQAPSPSVSRLPLPRL